MTLTITEAAAELGISPAGVRKLVQRGRITPIEPGAHPLRFHAIAVFDLQVQRRTPQERAQHDAIYAEVDAVLAGQP